jgi:hypothetical protein
MLILNAGISHNLKDWLICLTIESEKTKRWLSFWRDAGSIQTGTPFGYWIITGAVELRFRSGLYGWKAKI